MKLRHALIAAAVTLATVASATPASAYTYTVVGDVANDGAVGMYGIGTGTTIRSGATMDIDVECMTIALGFVAESGVDCYLRNPFSSPPVAYYSPGFSGGPVWRTGNTATFHLVFTNLPVANYEVCIGFGYTTSLGSYPDQWMNQGTGHTCSDASV